MNTKGFDELFKEYFEIGSLCESDQAKYNLICRYQDKVSNRLLKEKEVLRSKGKESFYSYLAEYMSQPSLLDRCKFGTATPYYESIVLAQEHGLFLKDSDDS